MVLVLDGVVWRLSERDAIRPYKSVLYEAVILGDSHKILQHWGPRAFVWWSRRPTPHFSGGMHEPCTPEELVKLQYMPMQGSFPCLVLSDIPKLKGQFA